MRKLIIAELTALKAPKSNKGFEYIVQAVEIQSSKETRMNKYMTLYSLLAEKNNDTQSRVERAIRHVISTICSQPETEEQRVEIFGTDGKITVSEFIACLVYYLSE